MAQKHTYRVLRAQEGDRHYAEGETRELTEADAAHLVALGVLQKVKHKAASKSAPGKAAQPHPNKAEGGLKNKEA